MMIYKVCSKAVWKEMRTLTSWNGSPHDLRDGFIHFSTTSQLEGTVRKHYAGQSDLMLLAVDADSLGEALKWEPSRDGDLFPHLYGPLPISTVASAQDLIVSPDGTINDNRLLPDE
ncbi:MAG: DUF952 domain-containing protein [Planctomycetaceae bacterium]